MKPPFTCRELAERLYEYIEDALTAEEKADWEAHIAKCPPCGHYLRSYQLVMQVSRKLREKDELPAHLYGKLQAVYQSAVQPGE